MDTAGVRSHVGPIALSRDLWTHRGLIGQFIKREIEGRYKGSQLGMLWSLITPILMLLVFTFVFGVVFQARWPHARGGGRLSEFALIMFAGQIAFQAFAEPVGRSAGIIVAVPNFVKKVVFPLQILPVAVVGAAAYHAVIGLLICCCASVVVYGSIPWTAAMAPFALLPLLMLGLGCAWFLAALGVYLRDIGHVIAIALQVLLFATPIFYPVAAVPESYRHWLQMNPLAPMVDLLRGLLIIGTAGSPETWALVFAIGLAAMLLGHAWFTVTRRGFADVL